MAGTQRPIPMSPWLLATRSCSGELVRRARCGKSARRVPWGGAGVTRRSTRPLMSLCRSAPHDRAGDSSKAHQSEIGPRSCNGKRRRPSIESRRLRHPRPPPDLPALDSRSVQGHLSLGNAYTKYPLLRQSEGLPQLVRRIMGLKKQGTRDGLSCGLDDADLAARPPA